MSVQTMDRQGYGPDIGGEEWEHVVSFKLKLAENLRSLSKKWMEFVNLDRLKKL